METSEAIFAFLSHFYKNLSIFQLILRFHRGRGRQKSAFVASPQEVKLASFWGGQVSSPSPSPPKSGVEGRAWNTVCVSGCGMGVGVGCVCGCACEVCSLRGGCGWMWGACGCHLCGCDVCVWSVSECMWMAACPAVRGCVCGCARVCDVWYVFANLRSSSVRNQN